MSTTISNPSSFLAQELDLNLGGFRVRLQSPLTSSPLTSQTVGVCYLEFIDPVTPASPAPDINITLHAVTDPNQWQHLLPSAEMLDAASYFQPEGGAWYYVRAKDGQEFFVLPGPTYGLFYQILKLDPAYQNGLLAYAAETQPVPLDPTLLFGYPLDRLMIANRLMRGDGFMLHASGIGTPGGALIFTGPSGAGKTTLCQLSQQFPDCTQFCDERIVVRRDASSPTGYRAYGTPWPGEGNIYNRLDGPLVAVFLIQHAPTNHLQPAQGAQALTWLLREIFPTTWNRDGLSFTMDFTAELLERLPSYTYSFAPTPEAIAFARQAVGL